MTMMRMIGIRIVTMMMRSLDRGDDHDYEEVSCQRFVSRLSSLLLI